jgi:acetyltransferase-like isoleucine patch superfamily enzyme
MAAPGILDHDWFPHPLPSHVSVGDRSWVYSTFAFLHDRADHPHAVKIGADTGIYNGTFLELGPDASVEIGDFCSIVGAIVQTNGHVRIGDCSFIAHEVVLADSSHATPPDSPRAGSRTSGSILLGENCWVGMRAVLLAGTNLGEGCIVGAGAVVDFAAPPFSIIAGNPARIVGTAR